MKLVPLLPLTVCLWILVTNGQAQTLPILDDFEDGDADGWLVPNYSATGKREVVDGDFVITGSSRNNALDADWGSAVYGDVSIHALFKTTAEDTAGLYVRSTLDQVNGRRTGYQPWAALNGSGLLTVGRSLDSGVSFLRRVQVGWDPTGQDVHLQFDVLGREASLTAWIDGTDQPAPQIIVNLPNEPSFVDEGRMGIWTFQPASGALGQVEFQFIEANPLTHHITGDFDDDGALGIDDLATLTAEIQAGSADLQFDMDQNGLVDSADRQHWVMEIKQTWIGDANLDGEFNSGDMVEVFQAGRYELDVNAGWAEGDWTGDQRFDTGDLVAAFSDGGYEVGVKATVIAVPEPTSGLLLLIGLIASCRFRKTC